MRHLNNSSSSIACYYIVIVYVYMYAKIDKITADRSTHHTYNIHTPTDRQTVKQTNRQTDRHTHTYIHTHKHMHIIHSLFYFITKYIDNYWQFRQYTEGARRTRSGRKSAATAGAVTTPIRNTRRSTRKKSFDVSFMCILSGYHCDCIKIYWTDIIFITCCCCF